MMDQASLNNVCLKKTVCWCQVQIWPTEENTIINRLLILNDSYVALREKSRRFKGIKYTLEKKLP